MFIILITWLFACYSVWFVLKKRSAWITVLMGAVMLLLNLSNLPVNSYYALPLYIGAALVLVFQVNLAKQNETGKNRSGGNTLRPMIGLVFAVFLVVSLVTAAAWVSPQPPLEQMGVKINTNAIRSVSPAQNWFNVFSSIQDKWTWVESKNQDQLLFTTGQNESETVLYLITSAQPVYLLTRRYDVYNSWGWTSNADLSTSINAGSSANQNPTGNSSPLLNFSVETRAKSDVILTAGQFISADIPVTIKTLLSGTGSAGQTTDAMGVTSSQVLGPYQHYNIVYSIPSFTQEQLSAAGSDYPDWVTQDYLQLPGNFPVSIKAMTRALVSQASTPYDKLMAIKRYLNTLEYDRNGSVPPEGQDAVLNFLYNTKKGNCVNFASAMVTMLRSAGVPARFCTGYLHGDYDKTTGKYIVHGKQAHAWAEVYFPDFGWRQVEATPDAGGNANASPLIDDATFDFSNLPSTTVDDYLPPEDPFFPSFPPVQPTHTSRGWIWFVAAGGLVLAVFGARKLFEYKVGRLVSVNNPSEAYQRMCYLAAFSQAGPKAQETTLEYSQRLTDTINGYGNDINNITQYYNIARYSPRKEGLEEKEQIKLNQSWQKVCHKLIRLRLQAKKWFMVRLLWNPP
jgi:transglutaminase-like putative cysteine protease